MSASALTAKLKDRVISKGYKVQNANHLLATSNMRGVVPCPINYQQIMYKNPICKQKTTYSCLTLEHIHTQPIVISQETPLSIQELIPLPVSIPEPVLLPMYIPEPIIVIPDVIRLSIDSGYVDMYNLMLNIDGGHPAALSRFLIEVDGGGP